MGIDLTVHYSVEAHNLTSYLLPTSSLKYVSYNKHTSMHVTHIYNMYTYNLEYKQGNINIISICGIICEHVNMNK